MSIKHQLEASVMLDKLGVEILAGEEAADRFDADRQAERMRAQTAAAVARLKELLIWLKREHDNPEGAA